ncbi:PucR family transcriptional regulator [Bacillus sp. RAR_GA_16]|uniref:PucR family transcriptional regulator n=1 Tax=Bacillus sp. RAR_GA_16 TaxID=2876774 RepID=UPI001CC9DA82|nr:PucR family transcriptional regulator [Bacillus sp. RAR_GA_16]MCA0171365.1 PucR family transcriptional regulator [Bacillus sp. RAR_GA_16]
MSNVAFTVHDMLRRPQFKNARVIAGARGLQNLITWAHILELTQVKHLLNGKECVLTTGIGWGTSLQHAGTFINQLIEKDVACLCIEIGDYIKKVPNNVIETAEKRNLPIIIFQNEVRFIDISQDINRLILDASRLTPPQESWISKWLMGEMSHSEASIHLEKVIYEPNPCGTVCVMTGFDSSIPYQQDIFQSFFLNEGFQPTLFQDRETILFILIDQRTTASREKRLKNVATQLEAKVKSLYNTISFGGDFHSLSGISESLRKAQETITIQEAFQVQEPFYKNLHLQRLILMDDKANSLEELIRDYLGEVIQYDEENDTELLDTLRVYLENYGSKKDTAEKLFVVRQTLYHRMLKLEEILGDNFIQSDRRLGLEMAMLGYTYIKRKEEIDLVKNR